MLDLDPGLVNFNVFILLGFLLPFIINISLSKSRGKNLIIMLFLTLVLSWIITLYLAILPKKNQSNEVITDKEIQ